MTKIIFLLSVVLITSGCALSREQRACEKFQDEGIVVGSLDSCMKCVETMGTGSKDAIQGCTMGLDAAKVLSPQF